MLTTLTDTKPTKAQTYTAAVAVADALEQRIAFVYRGAFHFRLGDGWTLALSSEDAGRFRLDACRWTDPVSTLWALSDGHERLAALATEMAAEIEDARMRA